MKRRKCAIVVAVKRACLDLVCSSLIALMMIREEETITHRSDHFDAGEQQPNSDASKPKRRSSRNVSDVLEKAHFYHAMISSHFEEMFTLNESRVD
jgi:hypothetical protein